MAAKKKSKRGSTSKRTAGKKVTTKKNAPKKRAAAKKAKKKTTRKGKPGETAVLDLTIQESPSGLQSGDLQGVSTVESAGSESVDELLEEGNAVEAGILTGVEQAGDDSEGEVHTHEVPEDDVPEEYLDKE